MNKLTGRKFFLALYGVSILAVCLFMILGYCMTSKDWEPGKILIPPILFAMAGIITGFIALQVVQERNISKDFQAELVGK